MSSFLWRLKYQPTTLDELVGREELVESLKQISSTQDIPHLLFTGPKEFGKIEVARLFAKHVLGEAYDTNCKIVYGSDPLSQIERDDTRRMSYVPTRRIGSTAGRRFTWPAFIFSRIKPFIEIKSISFHPLKILIIEDFHLLGNQQQGLRRLMERYSSYCRMILLTDQISSIIDPIISRCNVMFFRRIPFSAFKQKMDEILKQEKLIAEDNVVKTLYNTSNGDLGNSISFLQAAATNSSNIAEETVNEMAKDTLRIEVNALLHNALSQKEDLVKNNISRIKKFSRTFNEIMEIICGEVAHLPVVDCQKANIVDALSQVDFQTVESSTTDLMYDYLVYNLLELGQKFE